MRSLSQKKRENRTFLTVEFPIQPLFLKKTTQETTQETTQKILNQIRQNPSITREELVKAIGLSGDGIKYNLNKLKQKGLLKRIGPTKGGHLEVIE